MPKNIHLSSFARLLEEDAIFFGSLDERTYVGYLDSKGLTFLYGAKNRYGARAVVLKHIPNYSILFLKNNKMINSSVASAIGGHIQDGQPLFDLLSKYAQEKEIFSKVFRNLDASAFSDLMLRKEGLDATTFEKLFPELKQVRSTFSQKVAGFDVAGLDAIKEADRKKVESAIAAAASKVSSHGFKHLLYGHLQLLGSALKSNVNADYQSGSDQIRLKVGSSKEVAGLTRSLIHELGHRQEAKFRTDSSLIGLAFQEAREKRPILKIGTIVVSPKSKRMIEITLVTLQRGKIVYQGHYTDDIKTKVTAPEGIGSWPVVNGAQPEKHFLHVTSYAMTDPSEFFAEIFASAIFESNHELLEWLKSVTK